MLSCVGLLQPQPGEVDISADHSSMFSATFAMNLEILGAAEIVETVSTPVEFMLQILISTTM